MYYQGDQTEEDEMGRAYSMHVYNIFVWKSYWKGTPRYVVVDENILNRSKKESVSIWTVLIIMRKISGRLLSAVIELWIL
jgi:hypothetical protein